MPRMNGIEFLEAAMDLVPQARRALLTAYADTNAAISAINVVDVDHYLLKPWEPPEEKLYPVVDDLLTSWRRDGRAPVHKIKILGHPWSAASYEVRDFLARNQVPYRWYRIDEPDGRRLLTAANADPSQAPVVITADGTPLVQPSLTGSRGGGRAEHHPRDRLLRRDHHRRGTGRVGRGRLRRVRGPADGRHRAQRGRRPGRAELADRELPGLSRRGVGRPAHRSGPPAGRALRRRDPHRARRRRGSQPRDRPARCSWTTARSSPPTRWCSPPG